MRSDSKRPGRVRFGIRTLLIGLAVAAATVHFGVRHYRSAVQQRSAADQIRAMQGSVLYEYQVAGNKTLHSKIAHRPWLAKHIGVDFLQKVVKVDFWECAYLPKENDFVTFPKLRDVHTITCFDGPLDPRAIRYLSQMPRLRRLDLQRCHFDTDDAIQQLEKLNGLEELLVLSELPEPGFTVQGLRRINLATWKNLHRLHIGSPSLNNEAIPEIDKAPALTELTISYSQVDDAAVPHLAKMTQLRRLELLGLRISDQGEEELRRLLPNCKIKRKHPFPGE